jgi:cytochrome c-type biogenesis protein CcmH/NrfG
MILSGTTIGFIGSGALLLAALVLAFLDKKEKDKGNTKKQKFLSRLALGLFIAAFVLGVVVTLLGGIQPRQETASMQNAPMGMGGGAPMGTLGTVDEKELKDLQQKIEANPKDVPSLERLGHLYLQMQDFQNVFKLAHEALQENPHSAESRVHMGMVLFMMGEVDSSLAQFDQALASDPNNLEALSFRGVVLLQGKNDPKAARESWMRYKRLAKPGDKGWNKVEMFLNLLESDD